MRKVYISLFMLFGINSIQAQSYIRMIDTANVWNLLCGFITTNGNDGRHTDRIYFLGDTIFNDTVYQKQYAKIFLTTTDSVNRYVGALREDTSQMKIYSRNGNGDPTTETLLYNFSLQKGDSVVLSVDYYNRPTFPIKVDSIKSEYFAGKIRRIFYNEYFPDDPWGGRGAGVHYKWIEGIGSTSENHGIYPFYYYDDPKALLCFWQSGQLLYENPEYSDCKFVTVGIKELEDKESITIYPNPIKDYFIIKTEPSTERNNLAIYAMNGQEEMRIEQLESMKAIDISRLPRGVYFFRITNNKKVTYTKIIKE